MELHPLDLEGVMEIIPARFADHRGFFTEAWSRAAWAAHGLDFDFVQDNHSMSLMAGTLRGLHYQAPPHAQDKLVRATRGRVFDVAVDVRPGSPSYRAWVGLVLDAAIGNQILIPKGFAHGFQTLEPGCEVQYRVTAAYAPAQDRAIRFDDPEIGIDWPLPIVPEALSDKDRAAPLLADQQTGF
ncbi:MAG: dTDP-4-dehydrorhamnose 3,5-epimerase [Chakrabartia sp.]